jgi:hypothetical protein
MIEPEQIQYILAGEPAVVLFSLLLGAGIGFFVELKHRQEWKEAGRELGLDFTGFMMFKRLEGTVDGFEVQVKPVGKHGHFRIDVSGPGAIPPTLSLGAESILTRSLDGEDIQTGHPAFDYQARIFGMPEEAVALLDHDTRARVLAEVVEGGARVDGGHIYLKRRRFSDVPRLVRGLVDLGKHLALSGDVPERLARNAREDPLSSVRLRNLTMLQERYKDSPAAREASRSALASDQPNIRLAGARFLGREGLDAARELALAGSVEEDLRRQALEHFLRHA